MVLAKGADFLSRPLNICTLLFIIVILISIIFSGATEFSLFELYLFIPNILIFYIVSRINPAQKKQLIAAVFFAAGIIGIYAIYQYFFGFRNTSDYITQTWPNRYIEELLILSKKRVYATFITPNIFASYVAMMIFMGIGLLTTISPQKRKISSWLRISILIMMTALLFTKSLGGIFSFIVTFVAFLSLAILYIFPKLDFKTQIPKRMLLGISLGLSAFIFIFILFAQHRLIQFFNLKDPNNSIIQRFYYWVASIRMVKDHPLTGLGWRRFGSLYQLYKLPPANISHYSHNIFLQITAESGILGLLGFLSILVIFLRNGLKDIRTNSEQQGLKIGLFCGGCAFLLHNLIDLSFYFGQVSFFWWIILGLFA